MKLSIERVYNGYILRWRDMGLGAFKEPYVGSACKVRVFVSTAELLTYLNDKIALPEKEYERDLP